MRDRNRESLSCPGYSLFRPERQGVPTVLARGYPCIRGYPSVLVVGTLCLAKDTPPSGRTCGRILDRTSEWTTGYLQKIPGTRDQGVSQERPGTRGQGIPPPPPQWTDRHLWKHNLPTIFGVRAVHTAFSAALLSDNINLHPLRVLLRNYGQ